jgi:hypothetical protein
MADGAVESNMVVMIDILSDTFLDFRPVVAGQLGRVHSLLSEPCQRSNLPLL